MNAQPLPSTLPSCSGRIGAIFGHNFEPRFDKDSNGSGTISLEVLKAVVDSCSSEDVSNALDSLMGGFKVTSSVYVYDICTRCGLTIKRQNDVANGPQPA